MKSFDPEIHRTIVERPTDRFVREVMADWLLDYRPYEELWAEYLRMPYGYPDPVKETSKQIIMRAMETSDILKAGGVLTRMRRDKNLQKAIGLIDETLRDILPTTYKIFMPDNRGWTLGRTFNDLAITSDIGQHPLYSIDLPEIYVAVYHGLVESVAMSQRLFISDNFAKTLFERHPIRDVVLTRQMPEVLYDGNPTHGALARSHGWLRGFFNVGTWPNALVATLIWDRLIDGRVIEDGQYNRQYKLYQSRQLANIALSRACVDWGREQAELEPLVWEPLNGVW